MSTEKQLRLVTFEQAERLKAAGFDWETCTFYSRRGLIRSAYDNPRNCNLDEYEIAAPTVALALKWFRDVKGNFSNVLKILFMENYNFSYSKKGYINLLYGDKPNYETYEQAESALLDELLTLIEEEKL